MQRTWCHRKARPTISQQYICWLGSSARWPGHSMILNEVILRSNTWHAGSMRQKLRKSCFPTRWCAAEHIFLISKLRRTKK
ncbi:hypothetical protein PsorP6_008057 [Peronosclerospora sorghi]|uniref:Uncharacterized protein n=1 Tax=Peronosclerospora sorghi TaxID=230839 RepID=A0ACC0W9X6_9STRA|nr:hypothetical protein PsorP6_008057 [Peronosclerospora sorghi]